MSKRECYESRKNKLDGIWLNPKYLYNGQSAAKTLYRVRFNDYPLGC